MNDLYGKEHFPQTSEYIVKTNKTNLGKYDSIWFFNSDSYKLSMNNYTKEELLDKTKITNLERYEVEFYTQSEDYKNKVKGNPNLLKVYKDISETANKKYLDKGYILHYISNEDKSTQIKLEGINCGHTFTNHYSTIQRRFVMNHELCTICHPTTEQSTSFAEQEIYNIIKKIYPSTINRFKLENVELDIFIPELNFAIEYNGLYWHRDNINKHLDKTNFCNSKGIELLHIWEDDWLYKKDIILSIINNRFNIFDIELRSSDYIIKEITSKISNNFLLNNHIQGPTLSTIRLGLFYNAELVSVMIFKRNIKDNVIELNRFCSKINYKVYDDAKKLFDYFLKNYDYKEIVCFVDKSMFKGDLYDNLGFKKIKENVPDCYWVVNGKRRNKLVYSKDKLLRKYINEDISENEIMENLGYYKIWDCGKIIFQFLNI